MNRAMTSGLRSVLTNGLVRRFGAITVALLLATMIQGCVPPEDESGSANDNHTPPVFRECVVPEGLERAGVVYCAEAEAGIESDSGGLTVPNAIAAELDSGDYFLI